jgi:thiol-disulfide isomerase/thioredoxin
MKLTPALKFIFASVVLATMLACNASQIPQLTPLVVLPTDLPQPTPAASSSSQNNSQPYDAAAVPSDDIDAALTSAKNDGKLVLLDFGANWCPDCLVLSQLFDDPLVQPYLRDHFHVVHIDVGYWDRNLDTANKYGNPIEKGIPAVVILTSDEKTIATTKDGSLANASTATAQEILDDLKAWVAKKP